MEKLLGKRLGGADPKQFLAFGLDLFLATASPEIPIIVSSGYAPDQALQRFKEERPDGLLPKPYRATELTQIIEEILGR